MSDKEDNPSEKSSYDVFISHSSQDKEFSRCVAKELTDRGLSIWDGVNLKPGVDLASQFREAIGKSRICIFILSSRNQYSDPLISRQWASIQECSWKKPELLLCSLRLDDTPPPPFLRLQQSIRCKPEFTNINWVADQILNTITDNSSSAKKIDKSDEIQKTIHEMKQRFEELKKALKGYSSQNEELDDHE